MRGGREDSRVQVDLLASATLTSLEDTLPVPLSGGGLGVSIGGGGASLVRRLVIEDLVQRV